MKLKATLLTRITKRLKETLLDLSNNQLTLLTSFFVLLIFIIQYLKVRQFHSNPYLITSGIFKFTIYTILSIYGTLCLFKEEWVLNSNCWIKQAPLNTKTRVHYILEVSVYLIQLLLLQFDFKNKDFFVMVIHHLITLVLLVYSYKFRLFRIGQVIMVLHDISDPLLQLARLCLRFKQTEKANRLFFLFAFLFFFTRVIFFPVFCILPLFWYIKYGNIKNEALFFILKILWSFLVVLYFLNLVWFKFILFLLIRIFSKKELKDITKPSFTSSGGDPKRDPRGDLKRDSRSNK